MYIYMYICIYIYIQVVYLVLQRSDALLHAPQLPLRLGPAARVVNLLRSTYCGPLSAVAVARVVNCFFYTTLQP